MILLKKMNLGGSLGKSLDFLDKLGEAGVIKHDGGVGLVGNTVDRLARGVNLDHLGSSVFNGEVRV